MSVNINAMDLVFGIHMSNSPAFKDYRESDRTMRYVFNGLSAIGWIPVVGTIAGIARLIFTAIMHKNDLQSAGHNRESKAFYAVMVLRGVLETFSLGILLLIPDLILTAGRQIAFSSAQPMKDHHFEKYSSVTLPTENNYFSNEHNYKSSQKYWQDYKQKNPYLGS